MRYFDDDDAKHINAQQWQIDLLNYNPEYVSWGPHEDYMISGKETSWRSSQFFDNWQSFGPWYLDELNECVNFYFSVERENEECPSCGGNGYHAKAQEVVNSFYAHMNERGEHWNDKITQDEVEALAKSGRLHNFISGKPKGFIPTAAEVNSCENQRGIGHDAINRGILTRTRLERLGLPVTCDRCDGHGYVFTADNAHVALTLWWLHPRKGCSRGIEVKNIQREDLPAVFAFLRGARERNADRFAKVPK